MRRTVAAILCVVACSPWQAIAQIQQERQTVPTGEGVTGTPPVDLRQVPGSGPARNIVRAQEPIQRQQPFEAGSFLVYPEITLSGFYDSNVYYTKRDTVSDYAMIFTPAIWALSNWREHALNFSAGADLTRYRDQTLEDTNDWRVSAEGRYDFNFDTNVYGGARAFRSHEDRESPDARNGLEPTIYYGQRYYGGVFRQQGPWSFRLGGTALWLNYDDTPFITSSLTNAMINNDDRDRWQYTGGLRIGYELSPRLEPFVQLALDERRYRHVPDDLGYDKDSNGYRALAGIRFNQPNAVKLDLFAGYLKQRYEDSAFADVSAPSFGGALVWRISDKWALNAYLDRTVEETTVLQLDPLTTTITPASSFLNTYGGATLSYRFTERWIGAVEASYSRADYQGIDRTDNYRGAGGSLTWRVAKMLYLQALYQYRGLDSSVPTEGYSKNLVYLNIGIPFSR
jgi:hypothetical protein